MTKAIFRIRQYPPQGGSLDRSRAVCLGVAQPGENLDNTLKAVIAFERSLSRAGGESGTHYDPSEYIYIAETMRMREA